MIPRGGIGVAKQKRGCTAPLTQSMFFTSVRNKQQQDLSFVSQCRNNVTESFYDPGGTRVVDFVRRIR